MKQRLAYEDDPWRRFDEERMLGRRRWRRRLLVAALVLCGIEFAGLPYLRIQMARESATDGIATYWAPWGTTRRLYHERESCALVVLERLDRSLLAIARDALHAHVLPFLRPDSHDRSSSPAENPARYLDGVQ